MKKIILSCISLAISLFMINGCQSNQQEKMPGIDIPISKMNDGLTLSLPEEINVNGSSFIWIRLVNTSNNIFQLTEQSGIYVYQYVGNKWVSVKNDIDYGSGRIIEVYPQNGEPFRELTTAIRPSVEIIETNIALRVVIIGKFTTPDGDDFGPAGTFLDFWLNPEGLPVILEDNQL